MFESVPGRCLPPLGHSALLYVHMERAWAGCSGVRTRFRVTSPPPPGVAEEPQVHGRWCPIDTSAAASLRLAP